MENTPFVNSVEIVSNFIDKEISFASSSDTLTKKKNAILDLLYFIKLDIKPYAISAPEQTKEIWDYIRVDEDKTDFVMRCLSELFLTLGRVSFSELIEDVVLANSTSSDNSSIDDETLDRLPITSELSDLIGDNTWIIVIYIINTIYILDLIEE